MQTYTHVFPAGLVAGMGQHTVVFITEGERATRGPAERIARALSEYVAAPLDDSAPEYIRRRLSRADRVTHNEDGTANVYGPGWGSVGATVRRA